MKSSEIDIAFPVLGFTPDLENWGFPAAFPRAFLVARAGTVWR